MERKITINSSDKENNSPEEVKNKTLLLDFTDDTDIIECSILGNERAQKFLKLTKPSHKRLSTSETKDVQDKNNKNHLMKSKTHSKSLRNSLRLSLKQNFGIADDASPIKKSESSLHTPSPSKNLRKSNSMMKLISSLKKTPNAPYLGQSKLRNIEKWLLENDVETVTTPPFANLSVTPVSCRRKKLPLCTEEVKKNQDSSIDSEVEEVLKAVYGDDWLQKNVQSRSKTEPKKKSKPFSSVTRTERKASIFNSARRNLLKAKDLNLRYSSQKETDNLDNSVLSGVEALNLDSSVSSYEEMKIKLPKNAAKDKDFRVGKSNPSLGPSPVQKKKPNEVLGSERKKQTPKNSGEVAFKTPKKTFLASLSVSTPTSRCHPDAQDYKINFKSKKEELVKKLYKLYNSEIFDGKLAEDMTFSWNVKLRGTAGYCYNKRITKSTGDVIRQSRIEFSTKIVDRADRLRDTMIHELCHAASWVIEGVLDGHGPVWNRWAAKAMSRFPELPLIKRCHNYEIVSKYVYRCTGCGYSIKRHSKSINMERKRCGHCYGVLELLVTKKRKGKGEVPEFDMTRTLRTPNKFAIFVKENYHSVKSTKLNANHAEIMKTLGQQYALTKSGGHSVKKSDE